VFLKAILKKPWKSHKGKVYPPGTTFELDEVYPNSDSALYKYVVPNVCYGFLVIPNKVYKLLTEEEIERREKHKKAYEDHMKICNDRFIKGNK